jgi:hypothetical protein
MMYLPMTKFSLKEIMLGLQFKKRVELICPLVVKGRNEYCRPRLFIKVTRYQYSNYSFPIMKF